MRLVKSATCDIETIPTPRDKRGVSVQKRSSMGLGMHLSDHEDPGRRVAEENRRCFRISQVRQTPRSSDRPGTKFGFSEQTEK